jgi:7-carboxy-7-deazaguanine synthase
MQTASVKEIFYSIQGEGSFVGKPHYFVRFSECNLKCYYCDTDFSVSEVCQVEVIPGRSVYEFLSNPLSAADVIAGLDLINVHNENKVISLTGGEPLMQADLLSELIPELKKNGYGIYLETNGTLYQELEKVIDNVDYVSMDLKLQLFQEEGFLAKQEAFLKIAQKKDVTVKMVIDEKMFEQFDRAAELIAAVSPDIPVFIQPVHNSAMKYHDLKKLVVKGHEKLSNIRLVPQTHKQLNIK